VVSHQPYPMFRFILLRAPSFPHPTAGSGTKSAINTYRSLCVAERELRGLPNAMVRWVLGPVTERLINVGARMSEFGGAAEL